MDIDVKKELRVESAEISIGLFGSNKRLCMDIKILKVAQGEDRAWEGEYIKVLPQDQIKILMRTEKGKIYGTFGFRKAPGGNSGIYLKN